MQHQISYHRFSIYLDTGDCEDNPCQDGRICIDGGLVSDFDCYCPENGSDICEIISKI